jgi:hypothetical protein
MKKYFVFLLCLPVLCYGQRISELSLQSTYSLVGLNLGFSIAHQHTDKLAFTGGLNYLINRPITDNRAYTFRHRFYAVKPYQAIGAQLGIQRNFKLPESCLEPYFFYSLRATHAPTRSLNDYIDTTVIYQPVPQTILTVASKYETYPKSIWAFENIVGLGFQAKLYTQWYLNAAAGVGPALILMPSAQSRRGNVYRSIELGDYYCISIAYRIKTKS